LFVNGGSLIVTGVPRPKLKPDADLVVATIRVIERVGPARLTLAGVAQEAGMSPATLMQRFGSKRGLLLAVARLGASGVREEFARIRAQHRSPLRALEGVVECMAHMARTPEILANSLAFLEMDLADPDFHRLALHHARQFRDQIHAMIEEAVAGGELRPCPVARLANAVQGMIGGSMLNWAIHREGKAATFMRTDLETLLRPYRMPRRKQRTSG
jgi:AcrR family transcriptional regulator